MVGRWVSFWDSLFSGAMLNFGGVQTQLLAIVPTVSPHWSHPSSRALSAVISMLHYCQLRYLKQNWYKWNKIGNHKQIYLLHGASCFENIMFHLSFKMMKRKCSNPSPASPVTKISRNQRLPGQKHPKTISNLLFKMRSCTTGDWQLADFSTINSGNEL